MEKKSSISQLDYSFEPRHALIGAQMFFVAFGALVLVPLLTGMNSSVAMFTAGAGTLVFQVITKGRVPIFLASSFAFIAPISYGIKQWGLPATLCGLVAAGLLYFLFSLLVRWRGVAIIDRFLPPVVTGPVIMVIGLSLAPVAINMATGTTTATGEISKNSAMIIAACSLLGTLAASVWGKGVLRLIPIMCGIIAGYIASLAFGIVDFQPLVEAPWFRVPDFVFPEFNGEAVLYILPVAIAPTIEHVGNIVAIGSITGRDYAKDPGLHRTLLGDGVATMLASFLGGPPNTTYAEVSGGIALTRAFNPGVMTWAAISAIILAFVGKLGALLSTIPTQVMGGIMILLFGTIAVVGMNSLMQGKEDLMRPRTLAIIAIVLVFGLGGLELSIGNFSISGIGLSGITGFVLNLILPRKE